MRVAAPALVVFVISFIAACGSDSKPPVTVDAQDESTVDVPADLGAPDDVKPSDVPVEQTEDPGVTPPDAVDIDEVDLPGPPDVKEIPDEPEVAEPEVTMVEEIFETVAPPEIEETAPEVEDVLLVDEVETPEVEVVEEIEPEEVEPVNPVPASLIIEWSNIENMDMVGIKKKIVFEFDEATPLPADSVVEQMYNLKFEAIVTYWDDANGMPGDKVKLIKTWRPIKPGYFRKPALVLEPKSGSWDATTPYRLTFWTGGQMIDVIFHTLPAWSPGYKEVEFTVPVPTDCDAECDGNCAKCFPFPVAIHVFVPPEYSSTNPVLDNKSMPWNNSKQRYPVVIGLHGYNGQGMSMADAYGWKTLPRFSSQGVLEPVILVLVDGTVPQPYCGGGWTWPGTSGNTCYTQFMGIGAAIPNETSFVSYSYWLAKTMKKYLATQVRVRGMDNAGNIIDTYAMRRAHALTGLSGGGWGALIDAFMHPEAYGAVYGLMPTTVSFFNPWAFWYPGSTPTYEQICNQASNTQYPFVEYGDGYRDLSMLDPETGKTRDINISMREIKAGAKSCFWWSPQVVSNAIVKSLLCGMDVTCGVDQDAPDYWKVDFDTFPFDGNILFTTGIRDFEGPPAAFFDLDQQLDKRGVIHSFYYADQGGVYHDWQAIYDQVVGRYEIQWQDGTISPGNFPGTGYLYPFVNAAIEGHGNHAFNHPFTSEFTAGALDPDRDFWIDCDYPDLPDLKFVEDNCPGFYNPDQGDDDGDGIGDPCDDD